MVGPTQAVRPPAESQGTDAREEAAAVEGELSRTSLSPRFSACCYQSMTVMPRWSAAVRSWGRTSVQARTVWWGKPPVTRRGQGCRRHSRRARPRCCPGTGWARPTDSPEVSRRRRVPGTAGSSVSRARMTGPVFSGKLPATPSLRLQWVNCVASGVGGERGRRRAAVPQPDQVGVPVQVDRVDEVGRAGAEGLHEHHRHGAVDVAFAGGGRPLVCNPGERGARAGSQVGGELRPAADGHADRSSPSRQSRMAVVIQAEVRACSPSTLASEGWAATAEAYSYCARRRRPGGPGRTSRRSVICCTSIPNRRGDAGRGRTGSG